MERFEAPLRTTSSLELANEWALVLTAEGLAPRIERTPSGYVIAVPDGEIERAAATLLAYEREKLGHEDRNEPLPPSRFHLEVGLACALALMAMFVTTGPRSPSVAWFAEGSADAERILGGEPWRTVTALTLHADLGHVVANALAAAVFVTAACRVLGPGLGLAFVVLAGAGGNLLNALIQTSHHVAVGASTAVFGAVGLLAGHGAGRWRRRSGRRRRAWAPLAAGLALLAMLGTSPDVDIWAHLFGLTAGSALGVLSAAVRLHLGAWGQGLAGVGACGAVVYCWRLALQ